MFTMTIFEMRISITWAFKLQHKITFWFTGNSCNNCSSCSQNSSVVLVLHPIQEAHAETMFKHGWKLVCILTDIILSLILLSPIILYFSWFETLKLQYWHRFSQFLIHYRTAYNRDLCPWILLPSTSFPVCRRCRFYVYAILQQVPCFVHLKN